MSFSNGPAVLACWLSQVFAEQCPDSGTYTKFSLSHSIYLFIHFNRYFKYFLNCLHKSAKDSTLAASKQLGAPEARLPCFSAASALRSEECCASKRISAVFWVIKNCSEFPLLAGSWAGPPKFHWPSGSRRTRTECCSARF